MLEKIQSNISKYGHHIYLIVDGPTPRFAYTIGVSQNVSVELIMAGAAFYDANDVKYIINKITDKLTPELACDNSSFKIGTLGTFTLHNVDKSWIDVMMLGALDFYNSNDVKALQIVPDQTHWTLDIPNLSKSLNVTIEPAWQWFYKSWDYPISEQSLAVTNLDALRGELITEVMRWEENQWELFAGAGPDVPKEEIREVSLGTLLAIDHTLEAVTRLKVGKGLWRDPDNLEWHPWGS